MSTRSVSFWCFSITLAGLANGATICSLNAQSGHTLEGTVVHQVTGEPLDEVTVAILRLDRSTTTDERGRFVFEEVGRGSAILRLVKSGFPTVIRSTEVPLVDTGPLRLELPPLDATLIALGTESRGESSRGRKGEVWLELRPDVHDASMTVAQLLAREVPGFGVSRTSGGAEAGITVKLRGNRSVSQSNEPTIYIDGVRMWVPAMSTSGGGAPAWRNHVLDEIYARDVEVIRVMRGASAASIHADAANGLILIETRGPDAGFSTGRDGG